MSPPTAEEPNGKEWDIYLMKGTVHIDGGARGNPGPAAAAGIIKGKKPLTVSKYLGERTNNYAEYMAVVVALEALRRVIKKKDRKHIQIMMPYG